MARSRGRYPGIRALLERIKVGDASPYYCAHPSVRRWQERLCCAGPSARLSVLAQQAAEFDVANARDVAGTSVLAELIRMTLENSQFRTNAYFQSERFRTSSNAPPPYPLSAYLAALDAAAAAVVASGHPDGLRVLSRLAALR